MTISEIKRQLDYRKINSGDRPAYAQLYTGAVVRIYRIGSKRILCGIARVAFRPEEVLKVF